MIETDSYLYTANNDRDYAGSDEHNRSISCPANIFTRTSRETTRVYIHDEKVAYLTFEGRKEAKKIVKTTFLQKK